MTSREKLSEATFFLDRVRASSVTSMDLKYYVSACASALYGSLQHLLYDYAKRHWQFAENDYLDSIVFRNLAQQRNDSRGINFIDWWDDLPRRIGANEDACIIWNQRRMETHRAGAHYQYRVELFDALSMTGSNLSGHIEYSVVRPSGSVIPSGTQIPSASLVNEVTGSRVSIHFQENPSRSVEDVITRTITFVESLVGEAESRFIT